MIAVQPPPGARRRGPVLRLAAVACAGLLTFAACGTQDPPDPARSGETDRPVHHAGEAAESTERHHAHGSGDDPAGVPATGDPVREPLPVTVEIPAIGVHAELVGLGLNDDGSMEVPDFGFAGWYINGPVPGAIGPAVIAAHVDSVEGPDVFHALSVLDRGDAVHVHREDGSTASFVVGEVEQHPRDNLPGDRIWAASDRPRLTLITCGGMFDRAAGHYTHNVVVYATDASSS